MVVRRMRTRACSLIELLVVIAVIGVILAILVPSLFAARNAGARVQSMTNLKAIGQWINQYANDNRSHIVPSRFDYQGSTYPGKVKSEPDSRPDRFQGTWTDILWTEYVDLAFPEAVGPLGHDYSYDSPDRQLYDIIPDLSERGVNPMRSEAFSTRGGNLAHPGFFAANDFFNADSSSPDFNGWWTMSQMNDPERSLYAIDSFVGETIADEPGPWAFDFGAVVDQEVDYRYEGDALILFLDGHVDNVGQLRDDTGYASGLEQLEEQHNVKVRDLHLR